MSVPFEFCLCERVHTIDNETTTGNETTLGVRIAQLAVDEMNKLLQEKKPYKEVCEPLKLDTKKTAAMPLKKYAMADDRREIYRTDYVVSRGGYYDVYAEKARCGSGVQIERMQT